MAPADRLRVIDITECEQLRAQDFVSRAIVVVGTIQTLRVDNTTGRDCYHRCVAVAHNIDAFAPARTKATGELPFSGP